MKKRILLSILGMLAFAVLALAQHSPEGVWKTFDDETGEAKSHVKIYEKDGQYYGKIVKLLKSDPDKVCTECPGKKKGKPLMGMVILEGLKPHDDYWKKGTIMDPENGNEYGASVWFEDGNKDELKVRGIHWTGLYRTQTWKKVE